MLIFHFQNAPPVVVSVVRSTEILMAMIVDKIAFTSDSKIGDTVLNSIGAVVVLFGVSFMAASQQIQQNIDTFCSEHKIPSNIDDDDNIEKQQLKEQI